MKKIGLTASYRPVKKIDADRTERSKKYSTYYQCVVQNQELVGVRTTTKSRGTSCGESLFQFRANAPAETRAEWMFLSSPLQPSFTSS